MKAIAVYTSLLLHRKGGLRLLKADEKTAEFIAGTTDVLPEFRQATARSIGEWRRDLSNLPSEVREWIEEMLNAVPRMDLSQLLQLARIDLQALLRKL